ncbi:MAG: methyltransferase domain-containing protein [Acidobacteria bacterium]|nr:methyltransferase domain-containing protein [Acidobacteriota bacterium]
MAIDNKRNRVCPVGLASPLEASIRRWLQDPRKILSPFVKEGMTVLDIGCGPGFFSIDLAGMVGRTGKVISADLQDGMLRKLSTRIRGTELEARIHLVKCERDTINVSQTIDFGLAFWMVHEVPDKLGFFQQIKAIMNDQARILMVEPTLFHVSRKEFEATTSLAEDAGFVVSQGPRLLLSWSAVLGNA